MMRHPMIVPCLGLALLIVAACGGEDLDDEQRANRLLGHLAEDDYRNAWYRPPGYEVRTASATHHGTYVDIFINDILYAARNGEPREYWPDGSIVVKDGWDGEGARTEIAAMEKVDGEWFYALWDGTGNFVSAGQPAGCVNCHADGYDYLRAIRLP
jgi:hypothetical protein